MGRAETAGQRRRTEKTQGGRRERNHSAQEAGALPEAVCVFQCRVSFQQHIFCLAQANIKISSHS